MQVVCKHMLHVLNDNNDDKDISLIILTTCFWSHYVQAMLQKCVLPLKFSWKNILLHDSATWRGSYLTVLEVCVLSIGRQTLILLNVIIVHKYPCKGAHDGSDSRILHSDAFKSKWVLSFFKYLNLKVCNCNFKRLLYTNGSLSNQSV